MFKILLCSSCSHELVQSCLVQACILLLWLKNRCKSGCFWRLNRVGILDSFLLVLEFICAVYRFIMKLVPFKMKQIPFCDVVIYIFKLVDDFSSCINNFYHILEPFQLYQRSKKCEEQVENTTRLGTTSVLRVSFLLIYICVYFAYFVTCKCASWNLFRTWKCFWSYICNLSIKWTTILMSFVRW